MIRPLVYLREKDLARWCRIKGYDVIPKLCGADDVCRREMKEIIQRMDRETPGRVENIFRSLTRSLRHIYWIRHFLTLRTSKKSASLLKHRRKLSAEIRVFERSGRAFGPLWFGMIPC